MQFKQLLNVLMLIVILDIHLSINYIFSVGRVYPNLHFHIDEVYQLG